MHDVVILTDHRYENPKKIDWYIQQVLTEDNLLKLELEKLKLKVLIKDWKSKNFNWSSTKTVIFRSTWDYFDNYELFLKWLENTKSKTIFINSFDLINWNLDKSYLFDLNNKGVNIASTLLIKKNKNISLKELFSQTNWNEAIIKPTISGAAKNTFRINKENCHKYEALFRDLISTENFLFQEFLTDILINGEISIIIINGNYTHAVRKIAKKGDFRVQDDHGGTVEIYTPKKNEIEFSLKCVEACPVMPMYARVDIVYDNKGEISLVEIELIEPELWFRNKPKSAQLLALEIAKNL